MTGVLDGRAVLVTGASSGIGAATAQAVVAAGGRVALLARRTRALEELAAGLGPAAICLSCDVTSESAVAEAVKSAAKRFSGLGAVVNAAGVFTAGPVADTDPGSWRAMFEVNVLGLLTVVRAAVPHLCAGRAPSVVNVSSMSGRRVPNPDSGVYAATKFAVHALGEALRLQLAGDGIRLSTIAPSMVDTGIAAKCPDSDYARRFRGRLRSDGLSPAAVANAVVHVLSTPPGVNVVEYAVMSIRQ
jgi:NADP-dependent 3-hydroxy acid dehydrogenase YdfG